MLIKAGFFASLLIIGTSVGCFAQVPDRTMLNTLKCEAGKVGREMARAGLPANKRVIVSWTLTRTITRAGGLGLTFPWFQLGGSGELSREELDELKSDGQAFNLNVGNARLCRTIVNEIVKEGVGVFKCLVVEKFSTLQNSIEQRTGSASCKKKVTLSKKLKGNLRLNVWGVDLGPEASWGDIEVYEIAIAAPK